MATGKHTIPQQEKTGILRGITRVLRALDGWRLLVAFGLAVATLVVIQREGPESQYASWREVKNVQVTMGKRSLEGMLYVLPQTFQVDLDIAVGVSHRSSAFKADDFLVEINEQRLWNGLNSLPQNNSAEPQKVTYTVMEADIKKKPEGVVVRDFKPGLLEIKCDRMGVREVPVRLKVDRSQEMPGWTYECVPLTSVVRVTGPNYLLARMEPIHTDVITPKDTQSYRGMVHLEKPSDMPGISLSTDQIEYEVIPQKDSKDVITRAFNNLQIFFLMRGDSLLEPKCAPGESTQVDIHLRGPSKVLKALTPDELRVVCDLTPYTMAGRQNVKLRVLDLPDDVQLAEVLPRGVLAVELGYRHEERPVPVGAPEVVPTSGEP